MLRAIITLLEDFEEELGSEKIGNTNELRALGSDFKKRLDTVSGLLDVLEKHGWTWTTGARDITLYKNITKKDAEKELATLHVPEGIISFD
ncbi:MAG: hypothetical protein AABX98_00665 [Nanoarchaeota archaeon]